MTSSAIPADPYWKLRPSPPTPDDELCHCASLDAIMLRDSLDDNPLYCVTCNGEVAPERIGFAAELADDIASWRSVHRSLFCLWLDSGEYEEWAKQQLSDRRGQVNLRGLELASQLNTIVTTYFWWFHDADDGIANSCPVCSGALSEWADRDFQRCGTCFILI